jgi:hypothetical protein
MELVLLMELVLRFMKPLLRCCQPLLERFGLVTYGFTLGLMLL